MTVADPVHAAAVGRAVRLGKKPAQHLASNFKLAKYVDPELLAKAPASIHYAQKIVDAKASFPMYGNDRLGDCTAAAEGHQEQVWSFNAGAPRTPPESVVEAAYYRTGDGTDDGRYLDEMLADWRKVGLGAGSAPILGYAKVTLSSHAEVKAASWIFGGLYIGLGLPISAQSQKTWKVVPGTGQAEKPYSWGGHCVDVAGYTSEYVNVVTWGAILQMTWGFWDKYVDEAFALVSPDWLEATKIAPSGVNLAALKADLAAL